MEQKVICHNYLIHLMDYSTLPDHEVLLSALMLRQPRQKVIQNVMQRIYSVLHYLLKIHLK